MSLIPDPRANPDLLGHDYAERVLLEAWASRRMAHGWLICGPEGIGKASLAYRFARFLLAHGRPTKDGTLPQSLSLSPDHPVFRRVAAAGHADLLTIERGFVDEKKAALGEGKRRSEIVIDDIRDIGRFLSLTSAEDGWRVVIVDAACQMNRNAANAILKVLEEPSQRSILLLLAHQPGRLLPTILSRCRRLMLRPLAHETVSDLIGRFHPDITPQDRSALACLAEGSIGKALSLIEQGGLDLCREMIGFFHSAPNIDVPAVYAFAEKMGKAGNEQAFQTVCRLLSWWFARFIRVAAMGGFNSGEGEIISGEAQAMNKLLALRPLDHWLEKWHTMNEVFERAEAVNLDRKQVIVNSVLFEGGK